jgi:hypothetical protein
MPRVEFESTIPMFEVWETFLALDSAPTVIGIPKLINKICLHLNTR